MNILKYIEKFVDSLRGDFVKVQVIMDDDFVRRLDRQAQLNGLSRSAYVNMVMVRHVTTEEARAAGFERILVDNQEHKK